MRTAARRRGRSALIIPAIVLAGIVGGCVTLDSRDAVQRTFVFARAYFPAEATVRGTPVTYRVASLSGTPLVAEETPDSYREFAGSWLDAASRAVRPGARWPVVVFLHGCAGYSHYSPEVAEFYRDLGAVVVLPNSFARPGRYNMCNEGNMGYRESLRHGEADQAYRRLTAQPWVDRERIVLAGQSEGGNATASYARAGFAAHIVTGTSCRHNGGTVSAPSDVPVLAIKGDADRFYPGRDTCSVRGRSGGSKSILLPGLGHMALLDDAAKAAIRAFLADCCQIGPAQGAAGR